MDVRSGNGIERGTSRIKFTVRGQPAQILIMSFAIRVGARARASAIHTAIVAMLSATIAPEANSCLMAQSPPAAPIKLVTDHYHGRPRSMKSFATLISAGRVIPDSLLSRRSVATLLSQSISIVPNCPPLTSVPSPRPS
jgi:hypothetical protein